MEYFRPIPMHDPARPAGALTMAGGWALKLQAKVPGESETVEGTVVFKVK